MLFLMEFTNARGREQTSPPQKQLVVREESMSYSPSGFWQVSACAARAFSRSR
jgi:hypothetical protein